MLFLILFGINILLIKSLTPLSECTQGRITNYEEYENGGSCGFGVPKIYGAAPNEAFYNNGATCGICYELVTPDNVLYFMVDSHCPVEGNEKSCSGDMFHFDLHKNAFDSVIEDKTLGRLNITFRMVACDHKGNIILKTKKDVTKYFYSFVVMNHVIGLKKVYYSSDSKNWVGLEREGNYNHWTIPESPLKLPLYLQFESISGEKVRTQITEIKPNFSHDTGVQFSVPKNKYFDVQTLKEITMPKKEDCCKLDDAFTNIYDEGQFLGEWLDTSNCDRNVKYNNNCAQGSNKCIQVNLKDWTVFQIFNRIKPETKRYEAIEFYLKSEEACDKCLKIKTGENPFFYISTSSAGTWEKKQIKLSELGITSDKFRNILFQGNKKESQIFYFDNIKLVKSNYVDNGKCWKKSGNNSKYIANSSILNNFLFLILFLIW